MQYSLNIDSRFIDDRSSEDTFLKLSQMVVAHFHFIKNINISVLKQSSFILNNVRYSESNNELIIKGCCTRERFNFPLFAFTTMHKNNSSYSVMRTYRNKVVVCIR